MKGIRNHPGARAALNVFLGLSFVFVLLSGAHAQQQAPAEDAAAAAPVPEADAIQRRITRARALAAVGKLAAAAGELEALRASSADDSVRDVARILLMGVYVEMPDYSRANALLEEAYKARSARSDSAARSFYALAGQTVNSVRTHVERYRSFGINVADDEDLPTEAKADLDQLRMVLERVLEHAKAIREEEVRANTGDKGLDATALLEDAANVRLRLARGADERARWQQEVSNARQRLVASEMRAAKVSEAQAAPSVNVSFNSYEPAANITPVGSASNKPSTKERAAADPAKPTPAAPVADAAQPPAASKNSGGPVSVGALHGKVAKKVDPSYPQLAKTARISGVVTVFVVVDENGSVVSIQRADGPAQLQAAATDAVRRWKFKPTLIDGQAVRVSGYINFNFSL